MISIIFGDIYNLLNFFSGQGSNPPTKTNFSHGNLGQGNQHGREDGDVVGVDGHTNTLKVLEVK